MKALSLWQPHASLTTTGAKLFETRHWTTRVRGDILIHAAVTRQGIKEALDIKSYVRGLMPLCGFTLDLNRLEVSRACDILAVLPFGALVGIAYLESPIRTEMMTGPDCARCNGFGDFSAGRFAWPLSNVRRFVTPIPWKGRQGFFECDIDPSQHPVIEVGRRAP